MKCKDINRILDGHSWSRLSAAERSELNAHLVDCSACDESVAAYEALHDEPAARPAPDLLSSMVDRLPSGEPQRTERRLPIGWQTVGGLAAMGAVVMIAVLSVAGQQSLQETFEQPSEPAATSTPVAPAFVADTLDDSRRQGPGPRQIELAPAAFVEGQHFVALSSALQSVDALDRVTAWIFYMWSCLHCYEFEAWLSEWIADQDPEAVDVVRVPVQWNPVVSLHARAHYAAELLGVADRVSDAFFEAIHERGEIPATRNDVAALFSRFGIDRASFDQAFDSDRVAAELDRGRDIAARFGIDSTPTIVVDGRYLTSPGLAGSHQRATEVLDMLIARAQDARRMTGAEPVFALPAACDSTRITALDSQIESARDELEQLIRFYSERHPRVAILQQRLVLIEGDRAAVVDRQRDDCATERPRVLFQ